VSRVPLFCSFANRACSVSVASVSPFAVFSHSFLLLVLIPSKVSGWPSSLGRAEVCPSRYPHFWRIPFFPIWAESCSAIFESHSLPFFLPCPGFPRPFCCLCHERSLAFLVLFFSCLLSTDLSQSSLFSFFICAWRDLRILVSLYFAVVSFWDDSSFSGLQDPLGLPFASHGSSVPITFGLSLRFSFWAWLVLLFLGLFHYDLF